MSKLNFLRYAMNRMTEEQAGKVLAASGIRLRVGNQWVGFQEDGSMTNEAGEPVSAGVGAVTGFEVADERITSNGLRSNASGMQPLPGGPGSANFSPTEMDQQSRRFQNTGTGEILQTRVNESGVSQTDFETGPVGTGVRAAVDSQQGEENQGQNQRADSANQLDPLAAAQLASGGGPQAQAPGTGQTEQTSGLNRQEP